MITLGSAYAGLRFPVFAYGLIWTYAELCGTVIDGQGRHGCHRTSAAPARCLHTNGRGLTGKRVPAVSHPTAALDTIAASIQAVTTDLGEIRLDNLSPATAGAQARILDRLSDELAEVAMMCRAFTTPLRRALASVPDECTRCGQPPACCPCPGGPVRSGGR